MKICVITPVYACSESLNVLYDRLITVLSKISNNFEIVMVHDASPDDSWLKIKQLSVKDDRVKGIKLSKNYGQHRAITAGLDYTDSDWVVVMDCDLQDRPEEIKILFDKAREGYDIVFGRRVNRKDNIIKKISSKLFYALYDYFTESKVDNSIANFSIISRKVVNALRKLKEQNRNYPLFVNWIGFKRAEVEIIHDLRPEGSSSYTLTKLINLAVDSIVSQSNKPLKLSIKFGLLISLLSMIYGAWLIIKYFVFSTPVQGWTSVMVSIYFIGGLLFANMGILGLYIGKIFDETKNRPLYIIEETTFEIDL